jgi:hypothetical protein
MDTLTSITTIAVAIIGSVFGPTLTLWVKTKFEKKKPTSLTEAINVNSLVDNQISDIIHEIRCDRVWVAQFHNGGTFYPTGKSIQKFSIFYEKLSTGTASLKMLLQNIPSSLFPEALSVMHDEGELEIPSITPNAKLYGLESITLPLQTKSLCMIGLYSLDNQLIGIMGIAYNHKEHALTKDQWIYLRQKVGVIGTLLTEYLYANPITKK